MHIFFLFISRLNVFPSGIAETWDKDSIKKVKNAVSSTENNETVNAPGRNKKTPATPIQEFSEKHPSSFRLYDKTFIINRLHPERCFRHLSAMLHFNRLRLTNRLAQNEKSFGLD
ncbi:MAG TPA: hypothetical protein DCE73_13970 [Paraprevotella xylaniphila]|nr:hypothetical protein [Paraprevotella xylaniphila]